MSAPRPSLALPGVLLLALAAGCRHAPAAPASALVLQDLEGRQVAPLENPDGAAVCLFFLAPDCPISNVYAHEIVRIKNAYAARRIQTYLVYSDDAFTVADVRRHTADFDLTGEVLIDFDGELATLVGATVTPEAAVWTPGAGLVYRGRIDDLYVDFGKKRAQATTHDLRNALDAVLAGRTPAVTRTRAIGCFLPPRGPGDDAAGEQGHGGT